MTIYLNKLPYRRKKLPEAQRTQGIESMTCIIFLTEINLIWSKENEKKRILDIDIFIGHQMAPIALVA